MAPGQGVAARPAKWAGNKRWGARGVRLVFAADLHGDRNQYEELARLVDAEQPSLVVLGGDLFPHARRSEGPPLAFVDWLASWVARLSVPVAAIAGNDDWPACMDALAQVPGVTVLGLAPVAVAGLRLQGYPYVPPTPFLRQDYVRRDLVQDRPLLPAGAWVSHPAVREVPPHHLLDLPSVEEDLAALVPDAVWVVHTPPHGGRLDVIRDGAHVGSRALLAQVRRLQPPLVLGGHIHEAPAVTGCWAERVGRTVCVNPGRGQRLHAVVVDLQDVPSTLRHTVYGPWVPDSLADGGN